MLEDSKEVNNSGSEPLNQVQEVRPSINRSQKFFLAILLLIGLSMIGLWAFQLRQGITQPFRPKNSQQETGNDVEANNETVQNIDTDQDGLTDQDELNAYKTSPYLDDTDGDGIKDGDEIKKGIDPNCPEGRNCGFVSPQDNGTSTTTAAIVNNAVSTTSPTAAPVQPTAATGSLSEQDMKNMLEGKMSAGALRQALLSSGADPRLLGQLSDEELIKSYQKSLGGQ
jgi:cytoskeletal protein RodZ